MIFQIGSYGTGSNLYSLLQGWQQLGVYDIILPFLLVFTISFAVLQKVKIFGKDARKINVIVSLIIGMLFLQNSYLIFILQRFLPNISLIMVAALMFLLLVGVFGGEYKGVSGLALTIAFVFSIIVTLVALSVDFFPGTAGGGILDWLYYLDPGTQSLVVLIVIVVIVVAAVTHEKKDEGVGKRLIDDIGKAFGK